MKLIILIAFVYIIIGIFYMRVFNYPSDTKCNNFEKFEEKNFDENEIVCLYAYYEKDELYKNNFKFFINNGGLVPNINYYIIINGKCSVSIPNYPNIIVIKRENKGFDFGAYFHVLQNHIKRKYKYYVFLNTSVCGPYVKDKHKPWINSFLELFNKTDIKIVGTSINMYSLGTHVQSMFFVITDDYLNILKNEGFIDEDK